MFLLFVFDCVLCLYLCVLNRVFNMCLRCGVIALVLSLISCCSCLFVRSDMYLFLCIVFNMSLRYCVIALGLLLMVCCLFLCV